MAAGSRHGRGSEQVSLRLPEGMRDRIKAVADANNRSMNAEIIATLEDAYGSETHEVTIRKGKPTIFSIDDLTAELKILNENIAVLKGKGEI